LKIAAYALVTNKKLIHNFPPGKAIEVLFAHRGMGARRHIENIQFFIDHLKSTVIAPVFNFRANCSSNNYMTHQTQIEWVAEAQIVIAEHGAFQSNIMYMRKGSLFIELRGNYNHGEFINFERLARMFGEYSACFYKYQKRTFCVSMYIHLVLFLQIYLYLYMYIMIYIKTHRSVLCPCGHE
jgi:hypothetical protein